MENADAELINRESPATVAAQWPRLLIPKTLQVSFPAVAATFPREAKSKNARVVFDISAHVFKIPRRSKII